MFLLILFNTFNYHYTLPESGFHAFLAIFYTVGADLRFGGDGGTKGHSYNHGVSFPISENSGLENRLFSFVSGVKFFLMLSITLYFSLS